MVAAAIGMSQVQFSDQYELDCDAFMCRQAWPGVKWGHLKAIKAPHLKARFTAIRMMPFYIWHTGKACCTSFASTENTEC